MISIIVKIMLNRKIDFQQLITFLYEEELT